MNDKPRCPEVSDEGLPCQKIQMQISDGSWIHGGGHWFASDETNRIMDEHHIDAKALFSGLPASHHAPEDCPGPPECWQSLDG